MYKEFNCIYKIISVKTIFCIRKIFFSSEQFFSTVSNANKKIIFFGKIVKAEAYERKKVK